jgi:signal transduction histidine kinase
MSGYIQLLEKVPEKTMQFLPKINKQISRLSAIISDLLDISKIQAGKFEISKSTIPLNNLIIESVESARQLSSQHEITYSLPSTEVMLQVDVGKVTQVFMNIISNAIKYSPPGSRIEIVAEKLAADVRISIKDHGIGLAKENLDNIFLQFYRIASLENRPEGLGLGLYLCKQYVEAHHGTIWAESRVGEGTTIHISLPVS